MVRGQGANPVAWVEYGSRCLFDHFVQKSLPLVARQEFEEPDVRQEPEPNLTSLLNEAIRKLSSR